MCVCVYVCVCECVCVKLGMDSVDIGMPYHRYWCVCTRERVGRKDRERMFDVCVGMLCVGVSVGVCTYIRTRTRVDIV